MPTYVYTCERCEKTMQRVFSIARRKKTVRCPDCGGWATRNFAAEQAGAAAPCSTWPMRSDAAGVHPDQRQEATEQSVKDGVPTHFDGLGRAVFTTREHRRRYLRTIGLHDRNGGYGDT